MVLFRRMLQYVFHWNSFFKSHFKSEKDLNWSPEEGCRNWKKMKALYHSTGLLSDRIFSCCFLCVRITSVLQSRETVQIFF